MATNADHVQPLRKAARTRVLMRGTLFTPSGAYVVRIRDISPDGALVVGDGPLPSDCDVIFKRGEIFAAARIAWANQSGAGVKFYRDLSDEDVAGAGLPLAAKD